MVETAATRSPLDHLDHHHHHEGICYLNNAAQCLVSLEVRQAGWDVIKQPVFEWEGPQVDENVQSIRQDFATLIHAQDASDIAIMPSTAFAITFAAQNIATQQLTKATGNPNRKILLLQNQMCSAVYPWQQIIDQHKDLFSLLIIPHDETTTDLTRSILNALHHYQDEIIVACLPMVHWSDGSLIDLIEIGQVCRQHNIYLIMDGTQSIGILPCFVQEINATLVSCSVQKWLGAPPGHALVYISKKVQSEWQPLDQHGRCRNLPPHWNAHNDIMGPTGYPTQFKPAALKFDMGGRLNPVHIAMLATSIRHVVALDLHDAQQRLQALMRPLLVWAKEHGFVVPSHHAHHLIGLYPPSENVFMNRQSGDAQRRQVEGGETTSSWSIDTMLDICTKLQENDGVYISVRNACFRISPCLTNTPRDVERLMRGMEMYMPPQSSSRR